ncbi:MAG: hypothetical protein BGO94_10305 [Micrococcales bacterium 72-143]|nr:MAG: hypothetical protein BGO94_10305 [Micrococcales bacterium 72-143]
MSSEMVKPTPPSVATTSTSERRSETVRSDGGIIRRARSAPAVMPSSLPRGSATSTPQKTGWRPPALTSGMITIDAVRAKSGRTTPLTSGSRA